MILAELNGVYRTDLRFVPFYTKAFLASVMDIYYDQISLYKVCVLLLMIWYGFISNYCQCFDQLLLDAKLMLYLIIHMKTDGFAWEPVVNLMWHSLQSLINSIAMQST